MSAALRVEALKLTRSPVGVVATLAIVVGILALLAGITVGIAGGNPELIAKAGPAATLTWQGLLAGAAQITAAASILGFGIVLAWMFGREFVDGTITGLFALPIARSRIALAKLTVYALWAASVSIALTLGLLALGLLIGYGPPSPDTWAALGRLGALAMLSASVAVPVAWLATLTRSLLAAAGGAIGLVVAAEVGALAGAGGWLPFAAPALWAMSDGTAVAPAQLALAAGVGPVCTMLVCFSWSRLQLDR
ncbi:ABC transporter permease [Brachybacterium sp. JB7]|uniref:ABC transporter permease n=1 Tax=Brachybacterium sp. JB7 TaxID=2024478 RepID=UPI000DF4C67B|nr:ABC transporter permease [Brachybacterium sp. JB7]RCS66102.1 ABC transporter permease [Brachybacterium sp. JB7]